MKNCPRAGLPRAERAALCRVSIAIAVVTMSWNCTATTLRAELITLRFDATVGASGSDDVPVDLPFSFAQGESISGIFTFESDDVSSGIALTQTIQPFAVTFLIGGYSFGTSNYALISVNDTPVLTEPPGDIDPPPSDAIAVACSLGAVDSCGARSVGGPGSAEFDFFLRIVGNADILDGADLPSEPTVWNTFDSERILPLIFATPPRIIFAN